MRLLIKIRYITYNCIILCVLTYYAFITDHWFGINKYEKGLDVFFSSNTTR